MASYTPNLGLIKPAGNDNVAIQQLNANMDVLDREVHENAEKIDRNRVAPYIDSTTKHWMVYDPDSRTYVDSGVVAEARGPYINETNGDWMIWDDVNLVFVDSGIVAVGRPASMTANATTLPAGSSATASVTGTAENPVLNIGVPRGNTGEAAGFGTPTASVDANVGTPSVTVTATGSDTAKQFDFAFHNLKGQKGDTGDAAGFGTPTASVDANVGTPSVVVSSSGPDTAKNFSFEFHNLKGQKGDTGDPTSSTAKDIHMSPTDTTTIDDAIADLNSMMAYIQGTTLYVMRGD